MRFDMDTQHEYYMHMAIDEALLADQMDEVPVGAVLIDGSGRVLATTHNETITRCDPSAHAEILALRRGAEQIQNYRLLASTLYVTVEPCVMCMGAIIHARVGCVVFGAPDPKWGALGSLYDFSQDDRFNHHPQIVAGVCFDKCRQIMRNFFVRRR